jgi:hypothetical protein
MDVIADLGVRALKTRKTTGRLNHRIEVEAQSEIPAAIRTSARRLTTCQRGQRGLRG